MAHARVDGPGTVGVDFMQTRWALNQLGATAVAGLVAGGVAGWVGVARADGAGAVAASAVEWRMLLFLLLPLAAIVRAWLDGAGDDRDIYRRVSVAVPAAAALGMVGAAIGVGLWLVAVMQVSSVFGGENAADIMRASRGLLGWNGAGVAVALGGGGGIVGAFVAHRRICE